MEKTITEKKINDLGEIKRGLLSFKKALKKLTCQLKDFHNRINASSKLTAIMFLIFAFLLPVAPVFAENGNAGNDLLGIDFGVPMITLLYMPDTAFYATISTAFNNSKIKNDKPLRDAFRELLELIRSNDSFISDIKLGVATGRISDKEGGERIDAHTNKIKELGETIKKLSLKYK